MSNGTLRVRRIVRAFLVGSLLSVVPSKNSFGGPIARIDLTSLMSEADLVGAGKVDSVRVVGSEFVSVQTKNFNAGSFQADVLSAKMLIQYAFKGGPGGEISVRCYRNLSAWVPGISEGSYIIFLRKHDAEYLPAVPIGFLIPIHPNSLRAGSLGMKGILQESIAFGDRSLLRPDLDALSQLMGKEEFVLYVRGLVREADNFLRGLALTYLVRAGDRAALDSAVAFLEHEYADKEVANVGLELSAAVRQVKALDKVK